MNTSKQPFCISITGADDEVDTAALHSLQHAFPFVEWALLYYPEKEGQPRNPTSKWRTKLLYDCMGANTALHLCGVQVFRDILAGVIHVEFSCYGRLQININARHKEFTDFEVLAVYAVLLESGNRLILQCYDETEPLITDFLLSLKNTPYIDRVDVLLDASRGKGQTPKSWVTGYQLPEGIRCGYAGGLNPNNVSNNLSKIKALQVPQVQVGKYWLDMESGVRTDNHFDLKKVEQVIYSVALQALNM